MIERISGQRLPTGHPIRKNGQGTEFGALFQEACAKQSAARPEPSVNFSKHAMTRAEERGIEVDQTLMEQLAGSVSRAQEKGATNILAMDATRAFIINVPSGKVITAINQSEMKESIFTNIDGAVFL